MDIMKSLLVISDTHFDKRVDERKLNKIIELINKYDRVILLGDFWDQLHISADEFLSLGEMQPLFRVLKSKNCLYLYGNHDPVIEKNYSKFYAFCDEIQYHYSEKIGEYTYHFEHGDLLVENHKSWLNKILDFVVINYIGKRFFSRFVNKVFSFMMHFTHGKNLFGKSWNEKILSNIESNDQYKGKILVCGHTHFQHDYKSYINIGANLDRYLQYLVINENGYKLYNEKLVN